MNMKSNFFCGRDLLCLVHRAKEHDEYMDAEVIPDSDQLSSMYPVFVATIIIAVATVRAHRGKYRSFLMDLRNLEDAILVKFDARNVYLLFNKLVA